MERAKGIEPSYAAWEAAVLPLNYARGGTCSIIGDQFGKVIRFPGETVTSSTASPLAGTAGAPLEPQRKFSDPDWTAKGEARAKVGLDHLDTLWINTGSLCNIACRNCYIESSPLNDRLVYMTMDDVQPFLDEAARLGTREIGFTGGEPFMNPDFLAMLGAALDMGFEALVLTNAMQPMQRRPVGEALLAINTRHRDRLTMRVSLDHFTRERHEVMRGEETWDKAIDGITWLAANGFKLALAGRSCWGEADGAARDGYAALVEQHDWPIDAGDAKALVLFPEMDDGYDGPEITTQCWGILKKSPSSLMCAHTRMVVKRKGAAGAVVLPCTLLPYDPAFEMGPTLAAAADVDGGMFDHGAVKLCHRHCAKFCVLGGGSCS